MDIESYLDFWEKRRIWTHNTLPHHQKRLNTVAGLLNSGKRFIDVGCVFGHSTDSLRKLKPGEWSGLDFSERAVKKASELFPELIFYYAENFNLLPVCGQFDGVVCSEVIEHVVDDKNLVKGLIGIMKDTLVLTTPCRQVSDPGHLRVYTREALEGLFDNQNPEISSDDTFFYIRVQK